MDRAIGPPVLVLWQSSVAVNLSIYSARDPAEFLPARPARRAHPQGRPAQQLLLTADRARA